MMTFLILVTITTWSFGVPYPKPTYQIVNSMEEAEIGAYLTESGGRKFTEPDHHEYYLYRINLNKKSVTLVAKLDGKIHASLRGSLVLLDEGGS